MSFRFVDEANGALYACRSCRPFRLSPVGIRSADSRKRRDGNDLRETSARRADAQRTPNVFKPNGKELFARCTSLTGPIERTLRSSDHCYPNGNDVFQMGSRYSHKLGRRTFRTSLVHALTKISDDYV